jgi:hypothetical protein
LYRLIWGVLCYALLVLMRILHPSSILAHVGKVSLRRLYASGAFVAWLFLFAPAQLLRHTTIIATPRRKRFTLVEAVTHLSIMKYPSRIFLLEAHRGAWRRRPLPLSAVFSSVKNHSISSTGTLALETGIQMQTKLI